MLCHSESIEAANCKLKIKHFHIFFACANINWCTWLRVLMGRRGYRHILFPISLVFKGTFGCLGIIRKKFKI